MSKTTTDNKQAGMNRQHLYWKMADGKRYQLKIKEKKGRTEKFYELLITTNSLDRFSEEDRTVFLNMENDLSENTIDFDKLEEELNRITFPAIT